MCSRSWLWCTDRGTFAAYSALGAARAAAAGEVHCAPEVQISSFRFLCIPAARWESLVSVYLVQSPSALSVKRTARERASIIERGDAASIRGSHPLVMRAFDGFVDACASAYLRMGVARLILLCRPTSDLPSREPHTKISTRGEQTITLQCNDGSPENLTQKSLREGNTSPTEEEDYSQLQFSRCLLWIELSQLMHTNVATCVMNDMKERVENFLPRIIIWACRMDGSTALQRAPLQICALSSRSESIVL